MDEPTQKLTSQEFGDIMAHRAARAYSTPSASPDFLYIFPCNEKAKLAFTELLDQLDKDQINAHHAQFVVKTGKGPLTKSLLFQARSEGETTNEDDSIEPDPVQVNLGHYRVSFEYDNVTSSAKYVVGRGSARKSGNEETRDIDILLVVPRSKYSKGLQAAHVYLRMHPNSGVWMIQAAPGSGNRSTASSDTAIVTLDNEDIFNKDFRCLTKPTTHLTILDMKYTVRFALDEYDACERYRQSRNHKLQKLSIPFPITNISGIPLVSDIRLSNLAICSVGLGSGGHGTVYEAFDPKSGELRAVKCLEIKKENAMRALQPEIKMVDQHPNTRGLIRQYGWLNSNGDPILEVKIYPVKVYIVQDQDRAFHQCDWENFKVKERLKLFQDLLSGLQALHQDGYIHRDITRPNLLFHSGSPSWATLCDFGMLHTGLTDTNTYIGPWSSLPPEIVQFKHNTYGQSIDIWMLALALALTWFPRLGDGVQRKPVIGQPTVLGQLTVIGLELIRSRLAQIKDSGLARLLRQMLAQNPAERPSASEALPDPCLREIGEPYGEEEGLPAGKRQHSDDVIDDTL